VADDATELVDLLTSDPDYRGQLVHVEHVPPRPARSTTLPEDLPPLLRSRLEARGITGLWTHQAEAIALARAGTHVVVATGTASGKSLCYLLPIFERLLGHRPGAAAPAAAGGEDSGTADADQSRRPRDGSGPAPTAEPSAETSAAPTAEPSAAPSAAPNATPLVWPGRTARAARAARVIAEAGPSGTPPLSTAPGLSGSPPLSADLAMGSAGSDEDGAGPAGPAGPAGGARAADRARTTRGVELAPADSPAAGTGPVGGAGAGWPAPASGDDELVPARRPARARTRAKTGRGGRSAGRPAPATALYLAPTKALAGDQLRTVRSFALTGVRAATYDGDTPSEERARIRRTANFILTNPDMLHQAILPNHERWALFLSRLAYVVIDEAHTLRGVFGAHVAVIVRRLRRLARRHGAEPTFILASATLGNPGELAGRLTGLPVEEITSDGSPRGPLTFALWEPPMLDEATGQRRSTNVEAANWLAGGVEAGIRSLCFTRSRRGAELVATYARRQVAEIDRSLAGRVRAYRAGYLASERRELEQDLVSGKLLGVAATNALELGMDIGGLDAVILNGFPGTVASMWQQAGRAGRRGGSSLAVLIGADDPMDAYLLHHPDDLFHRSPEGALVDPENPYILGPHLACAAYESPLTEEDFRLFGTTARDAATELEADGTLRRRRDGLRPVSGRSPAGAIGLRNIGGPPVTIVERGTGQLIGTVDFARAVPTVHPGAIYLHQGESYKVDDLDLDDSVALVTSFKGAEYTQIRDDIDIAILDEMARVELPRGALSLGRVAVTTQVIGYDRRRIGTGELLGFHELDMPPQRLLTVAYWFTLSDTLLAAAKVAPREIPGAVHAAEHAQIGLLPLFAMCDRWDIGGLSTAYHPDTGQATIFVYDGYPGGAGITERGFLVAPDHQRATLETVRTCPCETGCPSCVQSPKCGNGNNPLDKAAAVRLLQEVVRDVGSVAAVIAGRPGR
jgi:DEAD/DEAH box helicase domain-containing protein